MTKEEKHARKKEIYNQRKDIINAKRNVRLHRKRTAELILRITKHRLQNEYDVR